MNAELGRAAAAEKPSMWGMLVEPGKQMERIRQQPRFVGALITIMLLSAVVAYLAGLKMAEHPLYQEQLAVMGENGATIMAGTIAVTTLFVIPLLFLLYSLVQWLLMMLFQGEATFGQLYSMNTYLGIFPLLANVVYVAVLWTAGPGDNPESLPTSLGALISAKGALSGILNGIEVFSLWNLAVSALGLSVIGQVSRGKGWAVALILYAAGLALAAVTAAVGETFGPPQ
ncbi:membrane protein YknW [Marinithermofilum abyssi]|uniref:Membrane protein YknW n=1 Tax=Marinithermofilum abyssi TaxID=1571185 RepID=A0A8J2VC54_9BACL|nr:Yip1 family protein [Marinithermofilum abyssi]GGE21312.1 membrane protein YknW [Marinithermofilum abyssi]